MFLRTAACFASPIPAGSTATSALTLSGRACATLKENHAGTDLVHQRGVGADNRLVCGGPARHVLLHEIVVGLDRKLARRHQLLLRRIGTVGARALSDAKEIGRAHV